MFLTLFRKDWRLAKPAFLFMMGLFLAPPLLSTAMLAYARWTGDPNQSANGFYMEFPSIVFTGLAISILAAPAIAASQLGREKRERSVEFLGVLPVSRRRIVASKFSVTTLLLLVPATLSLIGGVLPTFLITGSTDVSVNTTLTTAVTPLSLLLGTSGLAWFFSCFFRSEIFATAMAIFVSVVLATSIIIAFQAIPSLRGIPPGLHDGYVFWACSRAFLLLGVLGFMTGTIVAISRRTL